MQSGYGYLVVQQLMNHLDENSKKEAKIKASIVDVLSQTVLIAAGGSIGMIMMRQYYYTIINIIYCISRCIVRTIFFLLYVF